ncbi:uncharacterized protein J7T54_004690 [Emericellopsis cladophorae]|uniref:Uncharacterized protein n=1 Tax=Emericellopsis cladophorae TaxID=2686198 RepID=A0A9Q0BH83_9HYPO|nr:uncharacterized protein J7T54_004690 [Emericellopsis cladophorae]KAI6784144.1 hypothetical protein J7T54_004690 [Emericellopsis cladophorae]
MTTTSERTPLLARLSSGDKASRSNKKLASWLFCEEHRILFAGFLITFAFSVTQVPIFYAFHIMVCDVYYDSHPPYQGHGDRCSINPVTATTSWQYSIMGMSTTFCGVLNLFIAGWTVKKIGPRAALLIQTCVPVIRLVVQIAGLTVGKEIGMLMMQLSQSITIVGGPVGYVLIINIIVGEVVEPIRRTAVFGQLQGCLMLGNGVGVLLGGVVGDAIEIRAPFCIAFVSFLLSSTFARFTLPYISVESMSDGKQSADAGLLAPLRVLKPQGLRLPSGAKRKHYGVIFLCTGIFVGVIATDYAPFLIQMYATAMFDFTQADNGPLMAGFSFMRSFFLIFIFPRIITFGRNVWAGRGDKGPARDPSEEDEIPTSPGQMDAPTAAVEQADVIHPTEPAAPRKTWSGYHFDLFFLRVSLLVDGLLTTLTAFATEWWHIYLAAFLLPFGSGTAPAAKGVITQMCPESQRADALNAVTLIENIARMVTQGLFGFIFASLATIGKAYTTFFVNAAIAIVGLLVLLLSHFPPAGTELIDEASEEHEGGEEDERAPLART